MRTDHFLSALAVARFRARWQQLRRAVMTQRPALRWTLLAVAGLVLLAAVAFLTAAQTQAVAYLHDGQRFSAGDIDKITRALDRKHLFWKTDAQGRIAIESDHQTEAKDVLGALDVGPREPGEEIEKGLASGLIDGPAEKEWRRNRSREKSIESMIGTLDGVVSAFVAINRPKPRAFRAAAPAATAFVWLQTEGDRKLGFQTVQSIQNIINGNEPDIKTDAVTVTDRKGRHYIDASDPKVGARTRILAREEELCEKVLGALDHIHGVGVTVQVVNAPAPPAPSSPLPPAEEVVSPVAVNKPLELTPEPEPAARAVDHPAAPVPTPAVIRVFVKVPRSYYLKALPSHSPTADELRSSRERTEHFIKLAVEHVIAPGESSAVSIDTFPDEVPAALPVVPPLSSERRRLPAWGVEAGVLGAAALMLVIVGSRWLATRRRALRPSLAAVAGPGRFQVDEPSRSGPTERVRELIRLNPEAAASILQRWTGQGGSHG